MHKKIISVVLVILLIYPLFCVNASANNDVSLSAKSAILIDAETNDILFAKNEHEKRGIASTTKILTSLIALEYGEPDKVFTASKEAVTVEGTSIGLKPGDKITLRSLVYGMLLESGNDAANVTAYAISGSISSFSELMNDYASMLGMKNSSFKNPSGLTDKEHFSTAYDMAILTSAAIRNPVFKRICSTETAVIDFGTPEISRRLSNHNRLLKEYDGIFGVKTGYTKASGRCLVTACSRKGVTLICVTLNAYDDWEDHKKLYDYGFSLYSESIANIDLTELSVPVTSADVKTVPVTYAYDFDLMSREQDILAGMVYIEKFLYPPVKKGDIVGEVIFRNNDNKIIKNVPLIACVNANPLYPEEKNDVSFFTKIKKFIEGLSV
ncbi:MAG: D-alanyl-D-alanine carboxypeptidase [Clostridia bacterium]|nr:D-alanyl-D-alanine carboxypeptidase [Clostridia bacterium]